MNVEGTARSRSSLALVCSITFLAFAIRLYQLGGSSFWLDEGFSVYAARKPDVMSLLTFIAREDNHPPLHYLILQGWMALAGATEFAVRFISVIAGILAIPLLVKLGARIFDQRVGYIAAFLLAISPFHVWYSQEGRMYALVCVLAIVSVLLYLQWYEKGGRGTAAAYVIVTALMLLSHYYGFFVVAFENVAFLAGMLGGWRRQAWGRSAPATPQGGHRGPPLRELGVSRKALIRVLACVLTI